MTRNPNKVQFALVRNRRVTLVAALFINVMGFLDVAVAEVSGPCLDDKGNAVNPKCTPSELAKAYLKLGTDSASKRDYDPAIQFFDEVIKLSLNPIAFYYRANAYTSIHDYHHAIQDYDVATGLDHNFANAFNNRCFVYNVGGKYDLAIRDCSRAIELDQTQANFFIGRANAYTKEGDYKGALRDFNQAIQLNPKNANAYLGRARVYLKNKSDYDLALKDLDMAISLVPTNANAWNNRCWVNALKGELSLALKDCIKAVELRPTDPHALDSLAFTYLKMSERDKDNNSDLDNAIKNYSAALLISPNLASSRYGRGVAKLKKQDTEGGNADVSEAKKIEPRIAEEFESYGVLGEEDSPN